MLTEIENRMLDLIERLRIYYRDHHAAVEKENDRFFVAVREMLKTEENNVSKLSLTNGKPSVTLEDTSNGPKVSGQVDPAVKKELRAGREEEPVQLELKGGNKNAGGTKCI